MNLFRKLFRRRRKRPEVLPERAKELFNLGVAASIHSRDLFCSGKVEEARAQCEVAIDHFRRTVEMVPDSSTVAGALAHQLFESATNFGAHEFADAADYFRAALRKEPENVACLCELGRCKASLGDLPGAHESFQQTLQLRDSAETREYIASSLGNLAQRAYDYGTTLDREGKQQEAELYKRFAIGASMLGFHVNDVQRDLARQVSIFARDFGDAETAERYAALASE